MYNDSESQGYNLKMAHMQGRNMQLLVLGTNK